MRPASRPDLEPLVSYERDLSKERDAVQQDRSLHAEVVSLLVDLFQARSGILLQILLLGGFFLSSNMIGTIPECLGFMTMSTLPLPASLSVCTS